MTSHLGAISGNGFPLIELFVGARRRDETNFDLKTRGESVEVCTCIEGKVEMEWPDGGLRSRRQGKTLQVLETHNENLIRPHTSRGTVSS